VGVLPKRRATIAVRKVDAPGGARRLFAVMDVAILIASLIAAFLIGRMLRVWHTR
jgi:hypothetical protein